uniref:G-box-binding factor 3-like isoform X4 n=1 Tax=Rhizophora mucronata TaxID=61149 RepID=A0A2P2M2Z6_RHIMU
MLEDVRPGRQDLTAFQGYLRLLASGLFRSRRPFHLGLMVYDFLLVLWLSRKTLIPSICYRISADSNPQLGMTS